MEKKITKIQKLETIVKALKDNGIVIDTFDVDEYLANEQELARKKNANRKPSTAQLENKKYRATLLDALTDEGQTIKAICKAVPEFNEFTSQKMTGLLKPLIEEGKVVKEYDKKTAVYRLA